MKTLLCLALFTVTSQYANASADFCATQVANAAKALANANGTISEKALVHASKNGLNFIVTLTEDGGRDVYSVVSTGGHDCLVKSVKVLGQPTLRP